MSKHPTGEKFPTLNAVVAGYLQRMLGASAGPAVRLVEKMGTSEGALSDWRDGKSMSIDTIRRIAMATAPSLSEALEIMAKCAKEIERGNWPERVRLRVDEKADAGSDGDGRVLVSKTRKRKPSGAGRGRGGGGSGAPRKPTGE